MTPENNSRPSNEEHCDHNRLNHMTMLFPVISNPGNPTVHSYWLDHCVKKKNVETLSNFSSFSMSGVSHPSQLYAVELFKPERVVLQRNAIEG
tara:strand:- start:682 stop:960 length:279 start_codon:yes stop_codon:yes gene_type:complete